MSKKNSRFQAKTPRAFESPSQAKIPRAASVPQDHCHPEFKAEQMDMEGFWGWKKFSPLKIQELLQKIFQFEKMTWQELRDNGSHLVEISQLVSEARKRLKELKKDDLNDLFSLRLTGKIRVWGIKENNILWLLWWDPEHEICPSQAKNN